MEMLLTKFLKKPQESIKVDKRFYDTMWGEAAGGMPAELEAVTSVFINRVREEGYEEALKGSSAYKGKSKEYRKASAGMLNTFEKVKYRLNNMVIDSVLNDPSKQKEYYFMENLEDLKKGDPYWVAPNTKGYEDVGRQRFYFKKD